MLAAIYIFSNIWKMKSVTLFYAFSKALYSVYWLCPLLEYKPYKGRTQLSSLLLVNLLYQDQWWEYSQKDLGMAVEVTQKWHKPVAKEQMWEALWEECGAEEVWGDHASGIEEVQKQRNLTKPKSRMFWQRMTNLPADLNSMKKSLTSSSGLRNRRQ